MSPPRSLATIGVILGGEGPEIARNRSIWWSLWGTQGRRFGGSPRAPGAPWGSRGPAGRICSVPPGVRISVPPQIRGDTSKIEVFGKIPILNPHISIEPPNTPKLGIWGPRSAGGEMSEVSRIGELLNTVPGVHPRTVPRVPRGDPGPRQHPAICPIWRFWRSWRGTRSGYQLPGPRSGDLRSLEDQ